MTIPTPTVMQKMLLILTELGSGWVWRTSSPLELVFGGAPGLPPHGPPALCASQGYLLGGHGE